MVPAPQQEDEDGDRAEESEALGDAGGGGVVGVEQHVSTAWCLAFCERKENQARGGLRGLERR